MPETLARCVPRTFKFKIIFSFILTSILLALFLGATVFLSEQLDPNEQRFLKVKACKGQYLHMKCPKDSKVHVVKSFFKSDKFGMEWRNGSCEISQPGSPCLDTDNTDRVRETCDRQDPRKQFECKVQVDSGVGIDNCTLPFMEVEYECQKLIRNSAVCEGGQFDLWCSEGEKIHVKSATFGVEDEKSICSANNSSLDYDSNSNYNNLTFCRKSNVAQFVSKQCNGKNKCGMQVDKSVLNNLIDTSCVANCEYSSECFHECHSHNASFVDCYGLCVHNWRRSKNCDSNPESCDSTQCNYQPNLMRIKFTCGKHT